MPEELEAVEEVDDAVDLQEPLDRADLEELEPVTEEAETPAAAPEPVPDGDKLSEIAALVTAGKVLSWTVDDLAKLVEESTSAIVLEDGVFRIKEQVYSVSETPGAPAASGLRELAQDVIGNTGASRANGSTGDVLDEPVVGGIGDLLRDEDTLDLSQDVSAEKGLSVDEGLSLDSEKSNPIRLKRNGLDYDEFLSSYPRSFTHTTQMKSLVEVSRRVSAVSAGLFLKKLDGFVPDLTIGLSEKSVLACTFGPRDPLSATFLLARKAVAIDKNPSEIRFLAGRFDQEDIRYMKRMLFVPAVFRNLDAYLMLSFSGETDISIEPILSKLIVR